MFLSILSLVAIAVVVFGGLALIDGVGTPSKDNARTGTAGQALADSLVTPQPLTDSFSGVVSKMLAEYEGEAVIVIDPMERRVVATTDPTKATAIKSAVALAAAKQSTITPVTGQEGRSLQWERTDGQDITGSNQMFLDSLTEAVRPKRSVESLVSALIGGIGKPEILEYGAIIVVDQKTGSVVVNVPATENARQGLSDALAAVDPSTTDMAGVELSAEATEEETNPPIFEGGSTS